MVQLMVLPPLAPARQSPSTSRLSPLCDSPRPSSLQHRSPSHPASLSQSAPLFAVFVCLPTPLPKPPHPPLSRSSGCRSPRRHQASTHRLLHASEPLSAAAACLPPVARAGRPYRSSGRAATAGHGGPPPPLPPQRSSECLFQVWLCCDCALIGSMIGCLARRPFVKLV